MPFVSVTGVIDGVNAVFTGAAPPDVVYLNGTARIIGADYTLSGAVVTFTTAPAANSNIFFWSYTATGIAGISLQPGPSLVGDIGAWVAIKRLKRPDLLDQANENAFNAYNLIATKVPFEALQITSPERPVTAGQASYDLSDLNLAGIASIRMTFVANQQSRRLRRSHTRVYDSLAFIANGRTATYARFGYGIEMNPAPDSSSYTYRLRFWQRPPVATPPESTVIVTPPEWDELYRYETLYRTLIDIDEFEKASFLIAPMVMPRGALPKRVINQEVGIIPRLWNDLLLTVSQRENVDEDFGMNPVVRGYTQVR